MDLPVLSSCGVHPAVICWNLKTGHVIIIVTLASIMISAEILSLYPPFTMASCLGVHPTPCSHVFVSNLQCFQVGPLHQTLV